MVIVGVGWGVVVCVIVEDAEIVIVGVCDTVGVSTGSPKMFCTRSTCLVNSSDDFVLKSSYISSCIKYIKEHCTVYIMKLKRESDFHVIQDWLWRVSVLDGYNAVLDCGLYDYVRNNEVSSFMFPRDEILQTLYARADAREIHSGASYGLTMREVERIIKMGYDDWIIWYIRHNRPDILYKVKVISRQLKRSLSDPGYAMCRRRLQREYSDFLNHLKSR